MSKIYLQNTYTINRSGIDAISGDLRECLGSMGMPDMSVLRICLTAEELLLRICENDDEEIEGTLTISRKLFATTISFKYKGGPFNPTEDQAEWSCEILTNLGMAPSWSFRSGVNKLRIRVPNRGHRSELILAISLAAASVKVTSKNCVMSNFSLIRRVTIRSARTAVLPLPAAAETSILPPGASITLCCALVHLILLTRLLH